MKYEIQGKPYPAATVTLDANETIICQKGGMSWATPNVQMQTKGGSLGKMFGRALTGESMFQNEYTAQGGPGLIAFAAAVPGEIMAIELTPGKSIVAQKSSFLASAPTVTQETFFQKKISAGFFGGEGFIMQKFTGTGLLLLEIDGSVITYDLAAGQSMMIDTGHLAAMEETCSMSVETVKGIGNALLGGEGLFNTKVSGPGRIWLQTMPLPKFAGVVARFIPTKN